ncbi:transmembrane protein, putative (macronuclear) [Tetrahymena thermophila SB210]|uniref:Transmembrane protein, putative n=1 Tax=Tetrahymena thermophila (strain SB210) TaxID=312017 RepID=I7MMQ8_TETTS|nr:transmembrane protein, putative [Tetrahymena thermophila SB210]EAS06222.1 transmembrane protein, putative [Tetrahymena thermophila SB210]|eukprot:XP_001026467.1 transmembrane protein, putative [Tetrahymena thermophila SB210]
MEKCKLKTQLQFSLLSIKYGVYEETIYFNYNLFIKRLNVLSHAINIIPIISNCLILLNADSLDWLCLITTVYSLFHINLTNFMNAQIKQQRSSHFILIFIESLFMLIQMIFSYKALQYLDQEADTQLFNNFIQYTIIVILFFMKSCLLNIDTSVVNIIIYSAMLATILEFALSVYNIYQYKTKGPYEIFYQNQIDYQNHQQTMEEIVKNIERASLSHCVSVELEIKNTNIEIREHIYSFVQYFLTLQKKEKNVMLIARNNSLTNQITNQIIKTVLVNKGQKLEINMKQLNIFKYNLNQNIQEAKK